MADESKIVAVRFDHKDALLPPHTAGPTHSDLNLREALDLWEHANLLFHNYEWEEAIIAYRRLLKRGSTPFSKAQIWFNIGVVRCHLGEYFLASEAFTKALKNDNRMAVGWYMLGVTSFELGDFRRARRWFLACLAFFQDSVELVDYGSIGLDFALVKIKVVWNERQAMFEKEHKRSRAPMPLDTHYTLNRMPAGLIFEPHPEEIIEKRRTIRDAQCLEETFHASCDTVRQLESLDQSNRDTLRSVSAPVQSSLTKLARVRSLFRRRTKSDNHSAHQRSGLFSRRTSIEEAGGPSLAATPTATTNLERKVSSSRIPTYLLTKPLPTIPSESTEDLADDDSCLIEDPFVYDRQSLLAVPEPRPKHNSLTRLQRSRATRRLEGERATWPEGEWWKFDSLIKPDFGKFNVIPDGEGGIEDQILLPFNRPSWDISRARPSWIELTRTLEMRQRPSRGPWWEFEPPPRPASSIYSETSEPHEIELMANLSTYRGDRDPLARLPVDHPARNMLMRRIAAATSRLKARQTASAAKKVVQRSGEKEILGAAISESHIHRQNTEASRITVESAEFFNIGKDPKLLADAGRSRD